MTTPKLRKLTAEEKAQAWEAAAEAIRTSAVPMRLAGYIDTTVVDSMKRRAANIRKRGER